MRARTIRNSRRNGYAMLAVLVFLAVTLVYVSLNQRRTAAILRVERARVELDDFDRGPKQAVAQALKVLETGLPPSNPYECALTVNTASGAHAYRLQFSSSVAGRWSLECSPLYGVTGLPVLPTVFAP